MVATSSQKLILDLCRSFILISSVSIIARTSSGSVPSTTSKIPFFKNSSSRSPAASSSESNPSFLATLDKSIILRIIAVTSKEVVLIAREKLFRPPTKSAIVVEASIAAKAPPNVMIAEEASKKYLTPPTPALLMIPKITMPKHKIKPNNDAISKIFTFLFLR